MELDGYITRLERVIAELKKTDDALVRMVDAEKHSGLTLRQVRYAVAQGDLRTVPIIMHHGQWKPGNYVFLSELKAYRPPRRGPKTKRT